MDPLAHTLFGATLARSRLGRDVPAAGITLMVTANLPDIDAAAYLLGGDAALFLRRGWTHGPVGLLVLPWVWLGGLWLLRRWSRAGSGPFSAEGTREPQALSGSLVALAYLGVLSHPALDWMNTYGVRLAMPFDRRWFYGDVLFIVDPWMWLLLGAAAFLGSPVPTGPGVVSRGRRAWLLVALSVSMPVLWLLPWAARVLWLASMAAVAWIHRRGIPEARTRERVATGLLLLFGLYLAAMGLGAVAARNATRSELIRMGVAPIEALMVGPLPGTVWRREIVAATPQELRFGTFHWWREERVELSDRRWTPLAATLASSGPEAASLAATLADPCIAGFVGWMRFPTAEVDSTPSGAVVHLLDLRYTRERTTGFGGARVEGLSGPAVPGPAVPP